MKCLSEDELIDYLFSKDRSTSADIEAHLSICPACRAKLVTLKQLKAAAAAIPPAPVSADFTARLMRELKAESPAPAAAVMPSFFKRLFRPDWGFALAAFAGILAVSAAYFAAQRNLSVIPAQTLYFSDGPATVNSGFSAPGRVLTGSRAGYVYTDSCETAKCGIL